MSIPTHVSSTSSATDTNTNWPTASVQADDVAVETCLLYGTGSPNCGAPAGWTLVGDVLYSTTFRIVTAWKRLTAGEGTHAWPAPTGTLSNRSIMSTIVRGCPTTGDPWDVYSISSNTVSNNPLAVVCPTTTVADCLFVVHVGNPSSCTMSGEANADWTSVTERHDTAATNSSRHAWTGEKATAGASANFTATASSAARDLWAVFAFKPATGGPDTTNQGRRALLGVGK